MKGQTHNQGELKELTVKIEKEIVESVERMAKNSNTTIDEIVVVALKRFRTSHTDLDGRNIKPE